MGVVYRAHDPDIERAVAIKLIRADLLDTEDQAHFLARFRREAQAAGRCAHPNIVGVYDYALHEGNPFLAMEFVDGVALSRAREPGAQMDAKDAAADRKSTRLNSSHQIISYAVFCLKKKKKQSKSRELR